MSKVNARVLGAVVNGKRNGEEVQLSEKSAKHLEAIGYVEVLGKVKPEPKTPPKAPKDKNKDPKGSKDKTKLPTANEGTTKDK